MHPYATDSHERRLIPCLIAVLGVIATLVVDRLLTLTSLTVPWWFDSPAVLGFYGIFYSIFNKWLWQCSIFHKIGLVKLPNLNGSWNGYVTSSFDEHSTEYETAFRIKQDWNRISIIGEFKMSKSHSTSASVLIDDKAGITVNFSYTNEPSVKAIETMEMHHGFNSLTLNPNGQEMSGPYYSGRGRQNIGELKLEKV